MKKHLQLVLTGQEAELEVTPQDMQVRLPKDEETQTTQFKTAK